MLLNVNIRPETSEDVKAIHNVTASAFENQAYSNQKEPFIVDQLRDSSALSVSLVAEHKGTVIGHIAFSKVTINHEDYSWYGLGPVSVSPEHQNAGVGSQLIKAGLAAIQQLGAQGCVLLGSPDYYGRFGFKAVDSLVLEGVPPEYFMSMCFEGSLPSGNVTYHQAFADNS